MNATATLKRVSGSAALGGKISASTEIYKAQGIYYYNGATEFTPSDEAQTIEIAGKTATQNITINPIPSNYGKITWNGSALTVS